MSCGLNSAVLDRRLADDAPKDRHPGYAADLATMRRLISRGARSQGAAYRLHGLKRRYEEEYAELKAEARGQGGLLFVLLPLAGAAGDQHGGCDRRQQRERAAPE